MQPLLQSDLEPEAEDLLVTVLRRIATKGADTERCLAIRILGFVKHDDAAEILIEGLLDSDPDVRCDAATSLANHGASSVTDALLESLRNDPDSDVKLACVEALHALGSDAAVPLLSILVTGRGDEQGIVWDDDYTLWDDWLDIQIAAIKALGDLNNQNAVNSIYSAVIDPEGQDLWSAGSVALAKLGEQGLSRLEELAANAPGLARKRIATALSASEPALCSDLLARLISDQETPVRSAALVSAGALNLHSMVQDRLADRAPEIRSEAFRILQEPTVSQLARGLDDVSPAVRIAACHAIEVSGRRLDGLHITDRIERALRSASPELLATMIKAAAVTEPEPTTELVRDICNHRATDSMVRCACLQVMAQLPVKDAIDLVKDAAGAADRAVRLQAVATLGLLSAQPGSVGSQAVEVLNLAIEGNLVPPPHDWSPEPEETARFVSKRGSQAAGEEGDGKIKLDRDGNIVEDNDNKPVETDEAAKSEHADLTESGPSSTLAAIAAVNPEQMDAPAIELEQQDLDFLEMTGSTMKRRRLDPEKSPPGHIDIRRLAATIAGDTGREEPVEALATVVVSRDHDLANSAMESLQRLAERGVNIAKAEPLILQAAASSEVILRRLAIEMLGHINTAMSQERVVAAFDDHNDSIRVAAIHSLARMRCGLDLIDSALIDHAANVRSAAAAALLEHGGRSSIRKLLAQALNSKVDQADYYINALMADSDETVSELATLLEDGDPHHRAVALGMLENLIGSITSG